MEIKDLDIVPQLPGVYLWKNKFGNIIYVGKAKNLRNRMKQYFKGMQNSYKTQKLVSLIESFEYIITKNEKEALILERNLIEENSPEFNILLTDDKRYPYIKISLGETFEIAMVYRVKSERSKASYYGPFPTGFGAKSMLDLISRLTLYDKGLPIKNVSKEELAKKYEYAKSLLGGSVNSLIKELKTKMLQASENLQFEIAQDLKESIQALEFYQSKQSVELQDTRNIDIVAFVEKNGFLSVSMFFYRQGILLSKKETVIEITSSVEESSRQFLSQYYALNIVPDLLISNIEVETEIENLVPQKGQFKRTLDIALQNANDNIDLKLQQFIRKEELTLGAVKELSNILGMENINHILMIDNSNTNNTDPVSVIVSYRNGIKQPKEYRKYSVSASGRNADVEYMRQGVEKYFANEANVHPDLFIVDGGKAQINEVKKLLKSIPVIGLVKNEKHTTEKLINIQGEEISLSGNLLNFLKGMQIEVDRYAKAFHSRKKTTLEGKLINVKGVGPKVEEKLLAHFGSYAAIYNASIEQLSELVSEQVAKAIKEELTNN